MDDGEEVLRDNYMASRIDGIFFKGEGIDRNGEVKTCLVERSRDHL